MKNRILGLLIAVVFLFPMFAVLPTAPVITPVISQVAPAPQEASAAFCQEVVANTPVKHIDGRVSATGYAVCYGVSYRIQTCMIYQGVPYLCSNVNATGGYKSAYVSCYVRLSGPYAYKSRVRVYSGTTLMYDKMSPTAYLAGGC